MVLVESRSRPNDDQAPYHYQYWNGHRGRPQAGPRAHAGSVHVARPRRSGRDTHRSHSPLSAGFCISWLCSGRSDRSLAPTFRSPGRRGSGRDGGGAHPHVADVPISDLYDAPGATPKDQSAAVAARQATAGVFDVMLPVGLALVPIGLILLSEAVYANPAWQRLRRVERPARRRPRRSASCLTRHLRSPSSPLRPHRLPPCHGLEGVHPVESRTGPSVNGHQVGNSSHIGLLGGSEAGHRCRSCYLARDAGWSGAPRRAGDRPFRHEGRRHSPARSQIRSPAGDGPVALPGLQRSRG